MFRNWRADFAGYFNQGSSQSLRMKGFAIEGSLVEVANFFMVKYGIEPFSCRSNFGKYWSMVQYSLVRKGMKHEEFDELTKLAKSFNEGNDWC